MAKVKNKPGGIVSLFKILPSLIDRFFNWYGGIIADRAVYFIAGPILIAFVMAPGLFQMKRVEDEVKIWTLNANLATNNLTAKRIYDKYHSICSCDHECDEDPDPETCLKTCPDAPPQLCQNADPGLGSTCPNLVLMFTTKNKNLSMTDSAVVKFLLELDMNLTFGHYIVRKLTPAHFALPNKTIQAYREKNVTQLHEVCERRPDGSCIQVSILTAVRAQLSRLLGLKTYAEQNKFLLEDAVNSGLSFDSLGGSATYYPFDSDKPDATMTGPIFGDVELVDGNQTWQNGFRAAKVKRIGAMQMIYCLNGTDDEAMAFAMDWSNNATIWLEKNFRRYRNGSVSLDLTVSHSWSRGFRTSLEIVRMLPYLIVCVICLMIFTGLTTLRGYPAHRTLPWIGPIGVGCSMLGVGAAFGLVGWLGWEVVDLCFAIPVLILVVGIDDVFVYTEAWRETDPMWPIRKRMSRTMRSAAAGITVTSFMNSLVFIIDSQSPFLALQIFSTVSVLAAVFDYVFQMTLFPAALCLLSKAERKNRNAFCCCAKVRPRTNLDYRKSDFCSIICCTAPKSSIINLESGTKKIKAKHNDLPKESDKARHFFRDIYTPWLLTPKISALAMILYACYVVVCAYLATGIHVGLRFENTAPDLKGGEPNEVVVFFKHFRDFASPIEVIITGDVYYWEPETQTQINNLYEELMTLPNIGNHVINRNWLRDFVTYCESNQYNISTEPQFLYYLRRDFFNEVTRKNKIRADMLYDVKFADRSIENYYEEWEVEINGWVFPRIVASKLSLTTVDVRDLETSGRIIKNIRNMRQKYESRLKAIGIQVAYFSKEFLQTEPMLATAYMVVYNTLVQLAAVLLVTAFMMPHPVALFWIAIMLSSITVGVITITCSWGVDFDQVSMINIMLTMGYCVDFSAHMTKSYVASKRRTRYEKTREALGEFGFAVTQSSVAATMAVLCLGGSYAYILKSGFKFLIIGIILSAFHTLVFFPVWLLYLGPQPFNQQSKRKKHRRHDSKRKHRPKNEDEAIEDEIARDINLTLGKVLPEIKEDFRLANSSIAYSDRSIATVASGPIRRSVPPPLHELPQLYEVLRGDSNKTDAPFAAIINGNVVPSVVDAEESYYSGDSSSRGYERPPKA